MSLRKGVQPGPILAVYRQLELVEDRRSDGHESVATTLMRTNAFHATH